MPDYSRKSLAHLETCHPSLQLLFRRVITVVDCTILQGHRGEREQMEAYADGRSLLPWPKGNHNAYPSNAVDAAPYPIDWNNLHRFYLFAGYVRGVGQEMGIPLRLGADWDGDFQTNDQVLKDLVHFELLHLDPIRATTKGQS